MAKAKKTKVWVTVENYLEDVSVNVFKTRKKAVEWFEGMVRDQLDIHDKDRHDEIVEEALKLMMFSYPGDGYQPCTTTVYQVNMWE